MPGWAQVVVYFIVLLGLAFPLGSYMARVLDGQAKWMSGVERAIYRLAGIRPHEEQTWKGYAIAIILFNLIGALVVYGLQRLQGMLPLNPGHMAAVSPDSSFNTAISFATNTNWQGYGGESTMSYLTQMLALGVQNFLSAATGIAVLAALIRGFRAKESTKLGNAWVDITRSTLYILLPLSVLLATALVSQGVVQSFKPAVTATLLQATQDSDGKPVLQQSIPIGPVASQVAIKQLGTNGGGFYNVNSAHPLENPTPVSNFLECLAILLIPAALCITFGRMMGDRKQGAALLAAMTVILVLFTVPAMVAEKSGNPGFAKYHLTTTANWEGKESRFGIESSALWATATTAASNGSVNSMHDSYTPLGGMMPMILMQLGEVVFGGVGSGLYGMVIFAVMAVFIAGLMVGRTPEYLGKKIEPYEMKMASLIILIPCCLALLGTAIALVTGAAQTSMSNPAAHGFSQLLYNYSSMANNNGSAFAGFNANVPTHNILGGVLMWISRYWLIVPVLAMAGSLGRKKLTPATSGTLPTHTPLFVGLLVSVVLIVGALTFIPALALGPIVEHLHLGGLR